MVMPFKGHHAAERKSHSKRLVNQHTKSRRPAPVPSTGVKKAGSRQNRRPVTSRVAKTTGYKY